MVRRARTAREGLFERVAIHCHRAIGFNALAADRRPEAIHVSPQPRVRFSADKSPYKTNASVVLSRNGSKTSQGLVYFQFGAEEIFAAAGFYMPMPKDLHRLRAGMAWDSQGWSAVRKSLDRQGLTLMTDGALVRVPKGFESSAAALHDDLRLKSWAVSRSFPLRVARSPELADAIAGLALSCANLLEFGWFAMDET